MTKIKCRPITGSEQKIARTRAHKLMCNVRKILPQYKIIYRLVGSGKWGTMINDHKDEYDLDYQIEITKNSKEYKNGNICFKNVKKIKMDFIKAFEACSEDGENFKDLAKAITLINKNSSKKYQIDFVIVFNFDTRLHIIKKNKKDDTYTWNELPFGNKHIYQYFKSLEPLEKDKLINERIIPEKCKEKFKPTGRSSYEIFLSEVSNHESKAKDNRL